jgi:hypothetical protein
VSGPNRPFFWDYMAKLDAKGTPAAIAQQYDDGQLDHPVCGGRPHGVEVRERHPAQTESSSTSRRETPR